MEALTERERERQVEPGLNFLSKVSLVNKHADELEAEDDLFRVKHSDLDRGGVYSLRNEGLVMDSGRDFGRVIDYEITRVCEDILELIHEAKVDEALILDEYQLDVLERNVETVHRLPDDTSSSFTGAEFSLNSSLLASLRKAGFLELEEERVGGANLWSVMERTVELNDFIFRDR